ncbi:MAG: SDR family oxidoreductase [Proteobacteria bacterium]|nr:SDR family oxidoreductase [Pseudomonadota bacterium]
MKLTGRRVLITGASRGFGFAVAQAMVKAGADIALCGRNENSLAKAQQLLSAENRSSKIIYTVADVAVPQDVAKFVGNAIEQMGGIDVAITNAGIYGTKGPLETVDWQQWSDAIDINLKGSVLICKTVLPYLKAQRYGKIIMLSGGGATKPMPYLSAYAASKAAVVRFAETLAGEVADYGIDVNALAPGALNTAMLEEVLAAGPEKVGQNFYDQLLKQKQQGGESLEKGAALCVYLASAESDGISGKLISAIWDPWKSLNHYKKELQNSDIYTLRRIIPSDRGLVLDDKS